MARPDTITDAAQIAYDVIIRRVVLDAYRVGANRALEAAAVEIKAVDVVEWALAGAYAGADAAKIVRSRKLPEEA